jgi:hypothetical protein
MKIIILNGVPESGKGELARYVGGYRDSIINDVKGVAARNFAWDGVKDAEGRQLLCGIKETSDKYDGGLLIRKLVIRILDLDTDIKYATIDARESKDIATLMFIFKLLGYGAVSVLIRRDAAEKANTDGCAADMGVFNHDYDYEMSNNGSIADFHRVVDSSGILDG